MRINNLIVLWFNIKTHPLNPIRFSYLTYPTKTPTDFYLTSGFPCIDTKHPPNHLNGILLSRSNQLNIRLIFILYGDIVGVIGYWRASPLPNGTLVYQWTIQVDIGLLHTHLSIDDCFVVVPYTDEPYTILCLECQLDWNVFFTQ